jgi:hypothetical protein
MIERISHEAAPALAEDDRRSDRLRTLDLLRAQVSRTVSEGLERGAPAGRLGEIGSAEIAAFLDGSLSRAEWDAIAIRLVNDPAARAELAATTALLDEIQAQPTTVPAGLMERAAGVLAGPERERPPVSAVAVTPVAWYQRSMAWPGFALAVLAVVAVPVVLNMAGDRPAPVEQVGAGDTFSRGIAATPSNPSQNKDAQSCTDANEQARKAALGNKGPAGRLGEASTDNNDPCSPRPSGAGKQQRPASSGSN